MVYDYVCDTCNVIIEKEFSLSEEKPKTIECPCGGTASRSYKTNNLIIPEAFKEINSIKYDKRPSGKRKLY